MFCENCGCENPNDAMFCQNCGSRLNGGYENEAPAAGTDPAYADGFEDQDFGGPYAEGAPQVTVRQRGQAPAKRQKIHLSGKAKVGIIAGCVLVAAIAAFVIVGRTITSPERIVRKYVDALAASDWEKAYDYVNLDEGGFINKDNYVKMCESSDEYAKITNYEVNEIPVSYNMDQATDQQTNLTKFYMVSYTSPDGYGLQDMEVRLVRQSGNTLLFFPTWKVSVVPLAGYDIYVPVGAKASLDGTELTETYKDASLSNEYQDCYHIDRIFSGTHEIHVEAEYREPVDVTVNVENPGSSYSVDSMEYSQETINMLVETSGNMIRDVYSAALQSQDYTAIQDYFSSDAEIQTTARRWFENVQDDFIREDSTGVMNITCTNITGWMSSSWEQTISIEMDFDYTSEYTHYTGYGSSRRLETETENGSESVFVDFTLEDGQWKISDTTLSLPYYFY